MISVTARTKRSNRLSGFHGATDVAGAGHIRGLSPVFVQRGPLPKATLFV